MEKTLRDLYDQVVREMHVSESSTERGSPHHQLKLSLEGFLQEIRFNQAINPFELTNRVLIELARCQRL